MSMNRRDFGKVMFGVAGGLVAGAQLVNVASAAEEGGAKHACKGLNECKGQGGGATAGKNACKGQGDCASAAAKHDCAGKNGCKGQGGCKSSDGGCAGKNSCKGKGGCKVPVDPAHMSG